MTERILIAGYYGFGNLGDEAILSCALADLGRELPQAKFVVLSGDPACTIRDHATPAVSWTDPERILEEIHKSDLVLLGGGGLFQDYWGAEPNEVGLFSSTGQGSYAAIPLLSHLLRKPCMLYGVGLGPLGDPDARDLAVAAIERSQIVTVRDGASKRLAEELLRDRDGPEKEVTLTADPGFGLRSASGAIAEEILQSLAFQDGSRLVAISLRPWAMGAAHDWENQIASALDQYLAQGPAQGLFLPFHTNSAGSVEDDLSVARRVQGQMKYATATRILESTIPSDQMLSLIGRCDLMLGMRYHSVLFSLLSGVRIAALTYDPKVSQLMEEASLGGWELKPADWAAASVLALMNDAAARQLPVKESFLAEMKDRARESARLASSMLEMALPDLSPSEHLARRFALRYMGGVEETRALRQTSKTLREQAGRLLVDRNRMARELSDLRDTLGVRILDAYWRVARGIFPEGSSGRRIHRRASVQVRRLLAGLGIVMAAADRDTRESQLDLGAFLEAQDSNGRDRARKPSGDVRLELAHFEQHFTQAGSRKIVAIFSSTQLIESEGQRPTHFALGLAKLGIPVVFVYWRWDSSTATAQERLDEGILQLPIDEVVRDPSMLFDVFREFDRTVLFEFPHPDFFGLIAKANATGWVTVYDVIDDWAAFGNAGVASWYKASMEEHLLWTSDAVLAVNSSLCERVTGMGRNRTFLLPNGWPKGIERVDSPKPLPCGEITLGYFGHLADEWVDWRLLSHVARKRPKWKIHIIGYGGRGAREGLPSNILLLGKKPQSALAAYAANWDVGIVPFKEGPLAKGSDPIKTYEYMAMGLPVVMTGCYPPDGAENLIFRARGEVEFLAMAEQAAAGRLSNAQQSREFAAQSTWGMRVDLLLSFLGSHQQRIREKRSLFASVT